MTEVYEAVSLDYNKVLLLILFFYQCVSSQTSNIDLSLSKSGKNYYKLKTVCNIILWHHPLLCEGVWHFHGFLIMLLWEITFSWAITIFTTHENHAGLSLSLSLLFCRGHEMYQSKIYVTFMTLENLYSWLCTLFMVHE